MKKLYFIAFFLLIFSKINGQISKEETFDSRVKKYFESMEMPKVLINKNLVAYTTFYSEKIKGVETESVMNKPNFKNPYHIYIKSNKNSGTITIKNKNMADMIIDFQYIEKSEKENKITAYFFLVNNNNIEAIYNTVDGGHNMLTIKYNYDSNNSKIIQYVISQI